jgi:hypothetical protein
MARVLCTLPHASERINDVAFARVEDGMLSEDVADEVAAGFALIPGFHLAVAPEPAAPAAAQPLTPDVEGGATAAQHPPIRHTRRRA